MIFNIDFTVNAPVDKVFKFLFYTDETRLLYPEIKEVICIAGGNNSEMVGKRYLVKQEFRGKIFDQEIEYLEYFENKKIKLKTIDPYTKQVVTISCQPEGESTRLNVTSTVEFKSKILNFLRVLFVSYNAQAYRQHFFRLQNHFYPHASTKSIIMKINVYGLPFYQAAALMWLFIVLITVCVMRIRN
jgi:uncharacterized protein YndB with AHSA1/START domain